MKIKFQIERKSKINSFDTDAEVELLHNHLLGQSVGESERTRYVKSRCNDTSYGPMTIMRKKVEKEHVKNII